MAQVGRFNFNDGLTNNPERKIFNSDYVANLKRIDELFDKAVAIVRVTAQAAAGANVLTVEESGFFRIGDDILIRTPSGTNLRTTVNAEPSSRTQLPIQPIASLIPVNSKIIHSIPEIEEARGNEDSLADRLDTIENYITSTMSAHKAENNAHLASKINTSGLASLNTPTNVQAALETLATQKMNQSELTGINSNITSGDNAVRLEFQAADAALLNTINNDQLLRDVKINLFTGAGNYIVRDGNGFPKFPNVVFTQGATQAVKTFKGEKALAALASSYSTTLSSFLHLEANGLDYVYQIAGYNTATSAAQTATRRSTVDANGVLGAWVPQAARPVAGHSHSGAAVLSFAGQKRIISAVGGDNRVYFTNDLVTNNGTISSWTITSSNLPAVPSRPSVATVTVGSDVYIYVAGNNKDRRISYQRWNQNTLNLAGNWNTIFGGPAARGTTLVGYNQSLFLVGGSRHIYAAKLDSNGVPNFVSLGEVMPKFLNFPKVTVLNLSGKDYLFVTGGTSGSDYNTGTGNIDSFLFEINPVTLDLTLVKTLQGHLSYNSLGSGFVHVKTATKDWMFIHAGNGGTASGTLIQRLDLTKNVNYTAMNVTVGGGEYCINNEIVTSHPTQNFNGIISGDPLNSIIKRYLLVRKDGVTKEFRLSVSGYVSDPKSMLIGEITINSATSTGQATFFDQNIVQDLVSTGLYKSNSIISGCGLSATLPMTVNVSSGMFDFGGKVFGTTGMTINMSSFVEKEMDMLGPVNLPYKFEDANAYGSLCNIKFDTQKVSINTVRAVSGNSDNIPASGTILSVYKVSQGAVVFVENIDYTVSGGVINWISGNKPAGGSTYQVEIITPVTGNIKRFIYKLGGYTGSAAVSTVQKAELDSNGVLISNFASSGCAPLLQTSYSIDGAVPVVMKNGDRRLFMVCGGTNKMMLSNPINPITGGFTGWTQYATVLPFTANAAMAKLVTINNISYMYISGGGGISESIVRYRFDTETGAISGQTSFNFPATLDNSIFSVFDNKFAYLVAGNGNRKIYIGTIDNTGAIVWNTMPIADTLNAMQLHNAEIIKIQGISYLYIFGGQSGAQYSTTTKIPGMMRVKLDSDTGLLDGPWEFFAFSFDDPSELACSCTVEANGNILVYRSVGHTAAGLFTGDSHKINMIPIYASNFIGHSLLYFERSNNGTITVRATKRWDDEIDPLTILGLVTTDGTKIQRMISVAKQRKFDSGWVFADNNSRLIFQHNLLYPIKKERLVFRRLAGESETILNTEFNGYGAIVYHRPNRFVSVVLFGASGVASVLTDSETPVSSSILEGQVRIILEA